MRIQIDIEETLDEGGTASYRAWHDAWYGEVGMEFVSGWHETKWEAIQDLAKKIAKYEDEANV